MPRSLVVDTRRPSPPARPVASPGADLWTRPPPVDDAPLRAPEAPDQRSTPVVTSQSVAVSVPPSPRHTSRRAGGGGGAGGGRGAGGQLTGERVVPGTAVDHVVAEATRERVGPVVAQEHVAPEPTD